MRPAGRPHQTAITAGVLGQTLTVLGEYPEAEPLLTSSLAGLARTFGKQHSLTAEARQRLIRLYEAWDRPADADASGCRPAERVRGSPRRNALKTDGASHPALQRCASGFGVGQPLRALTPRPNRH